MAIRSWRACTAAVLLSILSIGLATTEAAGAEAVPHVFWASSPVRPGEIVLLHGSDLGGPAATVEVARLDDAAPSTPATPTPLPPGGWTRVPVLQGDEQSLKFVVPADWKRGVFACRVSAGIPAGVVAGGSAGGAMSEPWLLNAPDPWWVQGDEGEAASPGGWLRVMGTSLAHGDAFARLEPEQGEPIVLRPAATTAGTGATTTALPTAASDDPGGGSFHDYCHDYCLRFELPAGLKPGRYAVRVHNGSGGPAAWRLAGAIDVKPAPAAPAAVYSVLATYGPDAVKQMRESLVKYRQPLDRTDGVLAALKQAKDHGGGVVYFPAGRYALKGPLVIPEHTVLRGEGTGLVTLWWGAGHFNLDGGGDQGRARVDEPKPPRTLIYGPDFSLEDLSLYLPLDYEQAVVADRRLRMARVRVRIDHYWLVQGRGNGTVVRVGRNGQITDCDILAKGDAVVAGQYALVARNRIAANKSNTPLGGSRCAIVEDNQFLSMDPTAYQNISGTGRNIYYARNRHQALYAQQSDYSFTFDAGTGPYLGGIAQVNGTRLTLAGEPTYPAWAAEGSEVWRRSAVFILEGRGAGQWRDVTANHGRSWEIDRPFDVAPDASSVASIVSFNGRALILANHFEDANWVNAGYGTSVDVVCAGNELFRCADLMNHGVLDKPGRHGIEPSWHVQYFDNRVAEGQTGVGSFGAGTKPDSYAGPLTRWSVHRRHALTADNSGSIAVGGNVRDVVVEGCTLAHPASAIKVDGQARGVVCRANGFGGAGAPAPRYGGEGAKEAVKDAPPAAPEIPRRP